jgi:hypothetical protein
MIFSLDALRNRKFLPLKNDRLKRIKIMFPLYLD